jgi:ornithine cyclodeaminase
MPTVRLLTEAELRRAVSLDLTAVDIVEQAFRALAGGSVVMPPILSMAIAEKNGEVDVKTAYVPGFPSFALKVSPGFFDNPSKGLPSLNGLMILLSADTGLTEAVLLDNGYLTDLRTAAAGAVAARHLARAEIETVAVIGTGLQARLQVQALQLVRPFARVRVWGRDDARARTYAEEMTTTLGVPVDPADGADAAVAGADVVITTTPSRSPLVQADWLSPGTHVTAMGSDAHDKNELAPMVIARADRFVCDRRSQSESLGELRAALEAGIVTADLPVVELGAVCTGDAPGRTADDQITVCDLTGTGVQDTAIALHAFREAVAAGAGTTIET